MTYRVSEVGEMTDVAQDILKNAGETRLFALYGPMGAGKTTLIRQFIRILGVDDAGSSPTFSIVNEYRTSSGEPVYHFDFYRVESLEEVYDIGYEEYFYSDAFCFIEWAGKVEELLPEDTLRLTLKITAEGREITVR